MSDRVAIIVSHGQPSEPEGAERDIAELAARIGSLLPDWSVLGATLAGDQTLETLLIENRDRPLTIYPLFMSDGWFTKSVIPDRIDAALGPDHPGPVEQLPPLGLEPGLVELAADAVLTHRPTGPIEVVVAGHGSGKSSRPAAITIDFAEALTDRLGAASSTEPVRCGFVEQEPFLADVLGPVGANAICLPFFAARGGHVLDDLPAAAERAQFRGPILDPIGCHPGVPQLVADSINQQALDT